MKYSALLPSVALIGMTNAYALVPRQSCCPNGQYTDDLHMACHNGSDYGSGQCYNGNWEIQCNNDFNSGNMISWSTKDTRGTGEIWHYDECLAFCQDNADGFTAINIQPGESGSCQCLSLAGNSFGYGGNKYGASTFAQCPQTGCCEAYSGDLATACTNDAANAQGKCVTVNNSPFIINCNAVSYGFGNAYLAQNMTTLSDCLDTCNTHASGAFNAVNFQPKSGLDGTCGCSNSEDSFVAGISSTFPLYSLFQTSFSFC